jgi:hypothetical protein
MCGYNLAADRRAAALLNRGRATPPDPPVPTAPELQALRFTHEGLFRMNKRKS